jgi:hypothetical protein
MNRLAGEKSPYLLQHKDNPVDWYPWGEEAFRAAKERNLPVFLSIGYSTCHWCHVMERESFESEEIAELLRKHFISIKVDREERPDIDHIYMAACQQMNQGQGGWPLSAFLTPESAPFFVGMYFPPQPSYGRPSFTDLLLNIARLWRERPDELITSSAEILKAVELVTRSSNPGIPQASTLDLAFDHLEQSHDDLWGGFGSAPKFPRSMSLQFLLRRHQNTGCARSLEMVQTTLNRMDRGGIHDQIGGGFSRYSVDDRWLVPHFEKMLYDNALLTIAYLEAYQVSDNSRQAEVARRTLDYLLRDLRDPSGAFYCGEDADSEGMEGKFYCWTPEDFSSALPPQTSEILARYWDVRPGGNFEHGWSILNVPLPADEFCRKESIDPTALQDWLETAGQRLLDRRGKRIRPHLDDKVLLDWNGLTLVAYAKAARILGDPTYLDTAETIARFCRQELYTDSGRLLHSWRAGEHSGIPAHAGDHALFAWGLLELFETTFDPDLLQEVLRIFELLETFFHDTETGAYGFTASDSESLACRTIEFHDGAIPSSNAVAAWTLLRLAHWTGNEKYRERGQRILHAFGGDMNRFPTGFPFALLAVDWLHSSIREVVIVGDIEHPTTQQFLSALRTPFLPHQVLTVIPPEGPAREALISLIPYAKELRAVNGSPTVYLCQDFACQLPITEVEELTTLLQ